MRRFETWLAGLDAGLAVKEFPEGTRTAADAARAVGCELGQIVKSLVFVAGGRPVVALVSGANRLDEKRLADHLRDAFHYEVKFVSSNRPRVMTEEFTLDPGRLLSDYVDKVLADHPKREAIKVEARRVLKEALA